MIGKHFSQTMKEFFFALFAVAILVSSTAAQTPDYTGTEHWPTMMALTQLKNAGITDPTKIDFTKTKTVRLASEKIGKDLYRQVHRVTFTEKSGKVIEVITLNNVSSKEGSESAVEVFIVTKRLGKYP